MNALEHPASAVAADLHSHSTVSDGLLTPREVVERAADRGVELFALTDHDEVSGLAEADSTARALRLPFVHGVEVSVTWSGTSVHVVGLGIDPDHRPLKQALARVRSGRTARAQQMADGLAAAVSKMPTTGRCIPEIDLKNPDRYMASENIFQVAQDMGWWDPKSGKPFKFWEAYGGGRGKPYSTREFFVLSTLAPSLKLTMDLPELPFSVKPEKKLSVRDILAFYRDPYQGSDLDMTKNLLVPRMQRRPKPGETPPAQPAAPQMGPSNIASAWMPRDVINLVNALKPGTVQATRTIPISGCAYATVLQVKGRLPPAVGAV